MPSRKPLVLSGVGEMQQLQSGDDVFGTVSAGEFADLQDKFRRLLWVLERQGIDLDNELLEEMTKL